MSYRERNEQMAWKTHIIYYGTCKALDDAGIEKPLSQEGIDYCTEHCPYDYCLVVEDNRLQEEKQQAKKCI